ncbi:unnamed protein product [Parnassius mnemosyne]|uniref:THAP-type domain-containing protein n=1 Tax=Parnassius mnemosyne TaxID=213953 RepID=A0AAV1LPE3_9NEOP
MPKLCSFGCAPSGSPMHRFPNAFKFPGSFKAWVTLVGGKLESASDYEYYQKKLICDIHFTPEDRVRNNRLKAYAIPSLYLHGPSASFTLEQEPPLIVAHNALSHTSTLTPAITGTVRGIAPAVIMEHNYSAASRSTRKTFGKGTQYYLVTKTHMVL